VSKSWQAAAHPAQRPLIAFPDKIVAPNFCLRIRLQANSNIGYSCHMLQFAGEDRKRQANRVVALQILDLALGAAQHLP
jgi:hypothetical protein